MGFKDCEEGGIGAVTHFKGDFRDALSGAAEKPGGSVHPCPDQLFPKTHAIGLFENPGQLAAGKMKLRSEVLSSNAAGHVDFEVIIDPVGDGGVCLVFCCLTAVLKPEDPKTADHQLCQKCAEHILRKGISGFLFPGKLRTKSGDLLGDGENGCFGDLGFQLFFERRFRRGEGDYQPLEFALGRSR